MKVVELAELCHEANRQYCQTIGDDSQPLWVDAPDWQKDSAINGVKFHLANPGAPPSASHDSWLAQKSEEGWVYGAVKDPEKKEHPCMVEYDQLPPEQQAKDALFIATIDAHRDEIETEEVESPADEVEQSTAIEEPMDEADGVVVDYILMRSEVLELGKRIFGPAVEMADGDRVFNLTVGGEIVHSFRY